jgi:hypothetical protein
MDGTIGDPMSNEITKHIAVFVKSKLAGGKFKYTRNFVGTSTVKADAVEQYDDIKTVDASEWAGQKANDINYTDL